MSNAYDVTVCELLTAVCLYGLMLEYRDEAVREGRIFRIAVPVNLRPYFKEETPRNFFTCIPVELDPAQDQTPIWPRTIYV